MTYARSVVAPDVRRDVLGDAPLLEVREVLGERRPGHLVLEVGLLGLEELPELVVQRPHREALAEDLRRHALAQLALRAPVDDQRVGRPGEHVDEAGRDGQCPSRPRSAGGLAFERSPTAAIWSPRMPTSARRPSLARAVVDGAAADHDVEGRFPGVRAARAAKASRTREDGRPRAELRISSVGPDVEEAARQDDPREADARERDQRLAELAPDAALPAAPRAARR